jgi:hypothetical protein
MKIFSHKEFWGDDGHGGWSVYMRKWGLFGRLWLHVFERGDADEDGHDHPFDFWTFPLTSYVEEVTVWDPLPVAVEGSNYRREVRVVKAFRLHYRPAEYTHRVLGRRGELLTGSGGSMFGVEDVVVSGRIVTIVWTRPRGRPWGFLKLRDGRWCWQDWRKYVEEGGKHAPCE